MEAVKEFLLAHEEKLDVYTGAIAKVHCFLHPEVLEVRSLYEALMLGVKQNDTVAVEQSFARLSALTNAYAIPDDVCETFTAVYQDLAEADRKFRLK